MSPEDQKLWETEEMNKSIDFGAANVKIDPSPFQLVEKTSILKVHSLFSMIGINHAYVTLTGKLVGVVALKEVKFNFQFPYPTLLIPIHRCSCAKPSKMWIAAIWRRTIPITMSQWQRNRRCHPNKRNYSAPAIIMCKTPSHRSNRHCPIPITIAPTLKWAILVWKIEVKWRRQRPTKKNEKTRQIVRMWLCVRS